MFNDTKYKTKEIVELFLSKSRKQIIKDLGQRYNDMNERIWIYRLSKHKQIYWESYKYVYVIFNEDHLVTNVILRKNKIKSRTVFFQYL